ncbi:MAG: cupin domain-containing protein [Myxococcota bacterium]
MSLDVRAFALVGIGGRREFKPFREGVEVSWLYGEDSNGGAAALLRYAPGARVPRHRHEGFEHILVLEGSQCDDRGRYEAGTLIVNEPGSEHDVWTAEGCLVLVIWERRVTFVH